MSRGLGKLQRLIKELIEAQEKCWIDECERLQREGSEEFPEGGSFYLTWTEIRVLLFRAMQPCEPHDAFWLARERAAKRALYTLWKRGEIGRIRSALGPYGYMTVKTYNERFSPKALAELKANFERLAAEK